MERTDGKSFYAAGINFRKCDEHTRGRFALDPGMVRSALEKARRIGIDELVILSTCNRTEVYGWSYCEDVLINLVCEETGGDLCRFREALYVKKGPDAMAHIFHVAAGLDSQILGDYEIVGQVRMALAIARQAGTAGPFIDRLFSESIRCSREIKNSTKLSSGTISVSYAAVQWIRNSIPNIQQKKILLVGTGKIGSSTCKYLLEQGLGGQLAVINRNREKAEQLAVQYKVPHLPFAYLNNFIQAFDIIIVATNAPSPIISRKDLGGRSQKLVIDLSVPLNVADDVKNDDQVTLLRVDELSQLTDHTLESRKLEIPAALNIIRRHVRNFEAWNQRRRHASALDLLQQTLTVISASCHTKNDTGVNEKVRKAVGKAARELEKNNDKGCMLINAINGFLN